MTAALDPTPAPPPRPFGGLEAHALIPRPPGAPRLTKREDEVATLASARWTDREIADALVISVRTVESHLASVYRKVGVRSRRHLRPVVM